MKTLREKMQDAARMKPHDPFLDVAWEDPEEAKRQIVRTMESVNGSTVAAARRLGISRPALLRIMDKFGMRGMQTEIRKRAKSRFRLLD